MMRLAEAAKVVRGELRGEDAGFARVVIDSREVERGDLFVAIAGGRVDGHAFVGEAGRRGAVGAMVAGDVDVDVDGGGISQIRVADTTRALGALGGDWRRRFGMPVVAVTGSNGKTTVSALTAAILNEGGRCLAPRLSFNNQWGVPLTLLGLRAEHRYAVVEIGMNRRGEIGALSELVAPDIALVNNVAPAHLAGEGLGSVANVAAEKADIFRGLKAGGVAILNADDAFHRECAGGLGGLGGRRVVYFGVREAEAEAEVRAEAGGLAVRAEKIRLGEDGSAFDLVVEGRRVEIRLPLLGRHNVQNALAASAAAFAAGAKVEEMKRGLEGFAALSGRLRARRGLGGARILDDSYNANPASAKAALDVLAEFAGERIAVLGAMKELGARSDDLHREVGAHGRARGIERLLCLGARGGSDIGNYARGFGGGAACYEDAERLVEELAPTLHNQATVLVKGSRAAAMERVATRLLTADSQPNH